MVDVNEAKKRLAEQEAAAEQSSDQELTFENQPFTKDQLDQAWEAFAQKLKAENRDGDFAILKQPYVLNGNEIELTIPNSFQLLTLERLQQELLTFIRIQLQNKTIQLKAELQANDQVKMIYTNKEKFDYLAEKYPQLQELKNRLDLETDF